MLEWNYDDQGMWSAVSGLTTGSFKYLWTVTITEDGKFSVAANSLRMTEPTEPEFSSLAKAQKWCEAAEKRALRRRKERNA